MSGKIFMKGMVVGILMGATIGFVATPKSKNCRRATGRFLRTAGNIVENLNGFWD